MNRAATNKLERIAFESWQSYGDYWARETVASRQRPTWLSLGRTRQQIFQINHRCNQSDCPRHRLRSDCLHHLRISRLLGSAFEAFHEDFFSKIYSRKLFGQFPTYSWPNRLVLSSIY